MGAAEPVECRREIRHAGTVRRERPPDVVVVVERGTRCHLRQRVHAEGLPHPAEDVDHRGRRHRITDPEPGETVELGERPQRHDRHLAVAAHADRVRVVVVGDVLRISVVGHDHHVVRHRGEECLPRRPPEDRARRVVRIAEEDDARPRTDGPDHRREIVREVAQRHAARHAARRLDDQAVDDERLVRQHRLVAGAEKAPHDEFQELVRAVADEDILRRDAVACGEPLRQMERGPVGVAMNVRQRGGQRGERARRGPERILVGRELDGAADAELALELLDGLPRRVRGQAPHPLGDEAPDVAHGAGSGAAGYEPSTLSRSAVRSTAASARCTRRSRR